MRELRLGEIKLLAQSNTVGWRNCWGKAEFPILVPWLFSRGVGSEALGLLIPRVTTIHAFHPPHGPGLDSSHRRRSSRTQEMGLCSHLCTEVP